MVDVHHVRTLEDGKREPNVRPDFFPCQSVASRLLSGKKVVKLAIGLKIFLDRLSHNGYTSYIQ